MNFEPGDDMRHSCWVQVDVLLCLAQDLLAEMIKASGDEPYRLLESAREHVISARADVDADLK